MSVVKINVLAVPEPMRATLEERFAGRPGSVEAADGFEWFELLRPVEGTDAYLVYTRWRSEADFEAWQSSQDFGRGHAQAAADRRAGTAPAATGSTVWSFAVVQQAAPPSHRRHEAAPR